MEKSDKELYAFIVNTTKEVDETNIVKDDATGEESKITKKVKKKVPIRVSIKRPTRKQINDADDYFASRQFKYMRMGIMTKAMIVKQYKDIGGVMSNAESELLEKKYKEKGRLEAEFINLAYKENAKTITEEEKIKLKETGEQIAVNQKDISNMESAYSFIFKDSADTKAFGDVVLWYCLNLSYIKENEDAKEVPLYKGESLEEKQEDFAKREDDGDIVYRQISHKLAYLMSFYHSGAISTWEEFEKLDKDIESGTV